MRERIKKNFKVSLLAKLFLSKMPLDQLCFKVDKKVNIKDNLA